MQWSAPTKTQIISIGSGGDLAEARRATDVPPVDIDQLLGTETSNPFLRRIRIERGYLRIEENDSDAVGKVPYRGHR